MAEETKPTESFFRRYGCFSGFVPISIAFLALLIYLIASAIYMGFPVPGGGRIVGNEASSCYTLRHISRAQEKFREHWDCWATMKELCETMFVREDVANATSPRNLKHGYYFKMKVGDSGWSCVAMPGEPGETGTSSFYIDETGILRQVPCNSATDPPAGPDSPRFDHWEQYYRDRI